MNLLFSHLLHTHQNRRWFQLLDKLENQEHVTANDLAIQTACTIRTIQTDIKELKKYFSESILWIGNDEGQHLSLRDPVSYSQKKRALLESEPLFRLVDQLFEGSEWTNQEWAVYLSVSPASFGRIKKLFCTFLEETYELRLVSKTNLLCGEEAGIRKFMHDFYFTLPCYPQQIEDKITQMTDEDLPIAADFWVLDPVLLNQWAYLFKWRSQCGNPLPTKTTEIDLQEKLVFALDQVLPINLLPHEKAALFLLSLKEEQFIELSKQKQFVQQFSPEKPDDSFRVSSEQRTEQFFRLFLYLMKYFFQLPLLEQKKVIKREKDLEKYLLVQLMDQYLAVKEQISRTLIVSFDLTGTLVVRQWIKQKVRQFFNHSGYHLVEENQVTESSYLFPNLLISNKRQKEKQQKAVVLSQIPTEKEIKENVQTWLF